MYLKRLELIGFKSFADKTVLEFGPGFTAVVGPNGSGKSNIADAIRWVLGEPSVRELRGTRLEDVIFAGADGRRPLGYAEVSLVLDNADGGLPIAFTEVVVTRRVDRGGETEYLLNGAPCRLKDIQDLFLDTGLGRDSYSVIGQGRVDQVLSVRPEERRGLFEEAAGIARYRVRRREAARRLAETEQNLLRLGDLIDEVAGRLGDLEVQAERARRYRELASEAERLERGLLAQALARARTALRAHREREAALHARMENLREELSRAELALQTACTRAAALQEESAALRASLGEEGARRERADGRLRLAEQTIRQAQEEARRLEGEVQALCQRLAELDGEALRAAEELERAAAARAEAGANLAEAQEAQRACREREAAVRALVEDARARAFAAAEAAADRRNRALAEDRTGEQVARHLSQLQERCRALAAEHGAAAARLADVTAALAGLSVRRPAVAAEAAAAREALRAAEAEARERATALDGLRARHGAAASRLGLLEELRESADGYARGTRTVLRGKAEARAWARGVIGTVAELVQVDPPYERAIEVALGGAAGDIVVAREADARACIEELKRARGGRATFLPLDLVRPAALSASERAALEQVPGFVGVALDLCRFDPQVRPAIAHLLGRVAVARDLEAAVAMGRASGLRLRIVTLDGELLSPGGALTGGAAEGRASSPLAREQERRRLAAEVGDLEAALRSAEAGLSRAREQAERCRRALAALEEEEQRLEVHAASLEAEEGRWRSEVDRLERQLEESRAEAARLEAQRSGGAGEVERLRQEALAFEAEQARAQAELDAALGALRSLERELEEAGAAVTGWQVRLAELAQEERALAAQRERADRERERVQRERAEREARLAEARARAEAAERDREAAAREEEAARAAAARLAERKAEVDRELVEVQGRVTALERQLRHLRREAQETQEALGAERAALARLEGEAEAVRARAAEQFGVDPDTLVDDAPGAGDADAARRRLSELRQALEALGPVNHAAIEEHRQTAERHAFLTAQQRDLGEARESLYRAIEELDRRIETQFQAAFRQIRQEFQAVYRMLFEGGQADLVLLDEANLLDTGVEIEVQPPGKKRTPLTALSGGERALTAAALLFALLRVRPSPFVVLDEVDAALDEANVARLARYLRDLAGRTQVICITHQRGTMAVADALYGVTMEGTGVSRVVSVRLADADRRLAG